MYASVDWSITPRRCTPPSSRKVWHHDIYSGPARIRPERSRDLESSFAGFWGPPQGPPPQWGPTCAVPSSSSRPSPGALPTLSFAYLPHLD